MNVRIMEENDLDVLAPLHAKAFPRQRDSRKWLSCAIRAFPRKLCYVVEHDNRIHGYIIWAQKSGFRPEAVVELEQIAVHPNRQNRGIGQHLIKQSLEQVKDRLLLDGSSVKHVLVSTKADNHAQKIYRKVLGAEVEATISNLFSADEVYMIARNV